jgi:acyl-coenzyme A thioesterase PaaI-like protein
VIAALADYAMGQSYVTVYRAKLGELAGLATTQLSIDFIDPANMGAWLQIEPRIVHMGKTRGVMDAVITANGRTIGRANAAFRVVS